ncbi:MAG: endolytic transglycosylase MltG [Chitinophagales bacterium]
MKKRMLFAAIALLLLLFIFTTWELVGSATAFSGTRYFLYIKTGMNFNELMSVIEKDTVLKEPALFKWIAGRIDYPVNLKAGKYEIQGGMNLISILRMLKNGRQSPVNLVITKLRTKEDLASLVGKKLECDSSEFFQFLENNDTLRAFQLDTNTVMTAVLPNTYMYFWNTNPEKVFKKLFSEYKLFWNEKRLLQAREHGLNASSAYILASIVEEETNQKEDKGKMASVYLNRMNKGMKLAADPTIKFALRNFELKRIYDKYLTVESPYNTYKYAGLPPGPICTPSPETLDAVLNSPKTEYLYFVAKPDFSGYSNFSATFKQHMQYAKAYQESLDEQMKIGDSLKKRASK